MTINLDILSQVKRLRLKNYSSAVALLMLAKLKLDTTVVRIHEEDYRALLDHKLIQREVDVNGNFYMDTPIKTVTQDLQEEVEQRWEEYQNVFSINEEGKRGLKKGGMGSETGIKTKLVRFLKNHPDVDMDQIIDAARLHLEDHRKDEGTYKYTRTAEYFIYKKDGGDETSTLEAYLKIDKETSGFDPFESL